MKNKIIFLLTSIVMLLLPSHVFAYTVSSEKPESDMHILVGYNNEGLATGCHLEEGTFIICDFDKVVFTSQVVDLFSSACQPFGAWMGDDQPCFGSTPLIYDRIYYHKGNKVKYYDGLTCAAQADNDGRVEALECFRDTPKGSKSQSPVEIKPFLKIPANELKYWSFNAVCDFFDGSLCDYWPDDAE